jgi:hypothetical protein
MSNNRVKFVVVAVITRHNIELTAVTTPAISMLVQLTFREICPFELEVEAEIEVESEPYMEPANTSSPTACLWLAPLP